MKKILAFLLFCASAFGVTLNFVTLQSDFVQTITSENETVDYFGKFYAKSNNRAYWIYERPTPKKIYFDKNRVVVIEDGLEQAIISKFEKAPNLIDVVRNAIKITDTLYKAKYDGVEYLITVKNYIPTRIDYEDKLGNKIKITLSNTKKDFKISDDLLTPVIPSYYDIINQ